MPKEQKPGKVNIKIYAEFNIFIFSLRMGTKMLQQQIM